MMTELYALRFASLNWHQSEFRIQTLHGYPILSDLGFIYANLPVLIGVLLNQRVGDNEDMSREQHTKRNPLLMFVRTDITP